MKKNCWEHKKCGREPGGEKAKELGVCPSAIAVAIDGVHGGKNGGRACWVVSGTLCGGKTQGSFEHKFHDCLNCDFCNIVIIEKGQGRVETKEILKKLGNKA